MADSNGANSTCSPFGSRNHDIRPYHDISLIDSDEQSHVMRLANKLLRRRLKEEHLHKKHCLFLELQLLFTTP
jgi:hypothetical protein